MSDDFWHFYAFEVEPRQLKVFLEKLTSGDSLGGNRIVSIEVERIEGKRMYMVVSKRRHLYPLVISELKECLRTI